MCQEIFNSGTISSNSSAASNTVVELNELEAYARFVASEPEMRRIAVGFIGYGNTRPGERVLIAVDSQYDPLVVESLARALRDKGARVDIITLDSGQDREFDEEDEIRAIIRRRPYREEPRRYEGAPWIEDLAEKNKYDLLITGKAYIPYTSYRYEGFPWLTKEQFVSKATTYPRELHLLINNKAWEMIWEKGRGGKVHLTDPEGTDLTYDLWEEYFSLNRPPGALVLFGPSPLLGHLMAHPSWLLPKGNAEGTISGSTSHYSRPFPQIRVHIEGGHVIKVEGGGRYGEAWRELLEETRNIRYLHFPGPGLFWLWELAIGTNVKICRPSNIKLLSSGGTEWERIRSGVIHCGMGTSWRQRAETLAGEQGLPYGHLHVHLLFPTLEITTKRGEKIKVIDRGRLTTLDDLEVTKVAAKYGDPDELLKEDWIPKIPGINASGSYQEFAKDPASYMYHSL